jgi:hypothetical protein
MGKSRRDSRLGAFRNFVVAMQQDPSTTEFLQFRNNDDGGKAASVFAAELEDARTVYDVRTRIGGRGVTRTFKRLKDADATPRQSGQTPGNRGRPKTGKGEWPTTRVDG